MVLTYTSYWLYIFFATALWQIVAAKLIDDYIYIIVDYIYTYNIYTFCIPYDSIIDGIVYPILFHKARKAVTASKHQVPRRLGLEAMGFLPILPTNIKASTRYRK